jgi:hypothetical protein
MTTRDMVILGFGGIIGNAVVLHNWSLVVWLGGIVAFGIWKARRSPWERYT